MRERHGEFDPVKEKDVECFYHCGWIRFIAGIWSLRHINKIALEQIWLKVEKTFSIEGKNVGSIDRLTFG